VVSGQSEKPDH